MPRNVELDQRFGKDAQEVIGYATRERMRDLGSAVQNFARDVNLFVRTHKRDPAAQAVRDKAAYAIAELATFVRDPDGNVMKKAPVANAFGELNATLGQDAYHGRQFKTELSNSTGRILHALNVAYGAAPSGATPHTPDFSGDGFFDSDAVDYSIATLQTYHGIRY